MMIGVGKCVVDGLVYTALLPQMVNILAYYLNVENVETKDSL